MVITFSRVLLLAAVILFVLAALAAGGLFVISAHLLLAIGLACFAAAGLV